MTLTLSPDPAGFGAQLTIAWTGVSGPFTNQDWLSLFPVTDATDLGDPHNYVAWNYAGTGNQGAGATPGSSGSWTTFNAPILSGYYRISYNENGGYTVKERSNAILVVSAGRIGVPYNVVAGSTVLVSWDDFFPGSQTDQDWLPLYMRSPTPSSETGGDFNTWAYAGSGTTGVTVSPTSPGSIAYTMPATAGVYVMNYNSHGTYSIMAKSNAFTVDTTASKGFLGMFFKRNRYKNGIVVPRLWLPETRKILQPTILPGPSVI